MEQKQNNILIAVDGSEHSFEAVRCVGRMLPAEQTKVTLFRVVVRIPEAFWDIESNPVFKDTVLDMHAHELEETKHARDFMERAKQFLKECKYAEDFISLVLHRRQLGVAQDIIQEAQKGYNALVVGRRGVSAFQDMIFGSIANKLISRLSQVPVWVAGKRPDPGKILVATDCSEGSEAALDYVVSLFDGDHPEILLFHAIVPHGIFTRAQEWTLIGQEQKDWGYAAKEGLTKAEAEAQSFLDESIKRVQQKGGKPDRIKTRVVSGVTSRAGAILEEAKKGNYGTIVVGRRNISRAEEFFIGRVSNKILQAARETAVWVVR